MSHRRVELYQRATGGDLKLTACDVDLATRRVLRSDGSELHLTTREAALLAYLVDHASQTISRHQLLTEVWGYHDGVLSRAVDAAMRRLRTKVERDASHPEHLLVDHGEGYRFEPLSSAEAKPLQAMQARSRLVVGPWVVDLTGGTATQDGRIEQLTPIETGLLERLARADGLVVDRGALQRAVWGRSSQSSRAVDNAMRRLRVKLEPDPGEPQWLITARGHGYRLVARDAEPERTGTVALATVSSGAALWQQAPEAMWEAAVRLSERLATEARAHGGYALAPAGDTYRHAFGDPLAATAWAVASQRALLTEDWPAGVREALHRPAVAMALATGLLRPRQGPSDLVGPPLATAEALLASAPPGVVLVERDAIEPSADIATAPVFTRAGVDAVAVVPAELADRLRPDASPVPGQVALPRRRLFGRTEELERVAGLLREINQPVVLVGPSGIGKTRLARELATRSPGTLWVGLVPGSGQNAALAALCAALGGEVPRRRADAVAVLSTLIAHRRPTLLVVDDVEVLDDDLRAWLDAIARDRTCPVLLTAQTRRAAPNALGVELQPLPPKDARALFADIAGQRIEPAAEVAIDELGGHPLSLELVGARVAEGTLTDVLDEVVAHAPSTLEEVVDLAMGRLPELEHSVLRQLCVFEGGFDLAAARAVVHLPDGAAVTDILQDLRDRSLVRTITADQSSLRLAVEPAVKARLGAAGAEVNERHGAWFGRLGRGDVVGRIGRQPMVIAWLWQERDNLMAVCRRGGVAANHAYVGLARALTEHGAWEQAATLGRTLLDGPRLEGWAQVVATVAAVTFDGGHAEQVDVLLSALDLEALPPSAHTAVVLLKARTALRAGDPKRAEAAALRALDRAEADTWQAGRAHAVLAAVLDSRTEPDRVEHHYRAALEVLDGGGWSMWALGTRADLGCHLSDIGRHDEAEGLFETALASAEALELWRHVVHLRLNLAVHASRTGHRARSRDELAAAIALARRVGTPTLLASSTTNLALQLLDVGHVSQAVTHAAEGAELFEQLGNLPSAAWARGIQAEGLSLQGDVTAVSHMRAALEVARAHADGRTRYRLLLRAVPVFATAGHTEDARAAHAEALQLEIPAGIREDGADALRKAALALALADDGTPPGS